MSKKNLKIIAVATIFNACTIGAAQADYVDYLAQERESANSYFDLTSILQFFGIAAEVLESPTNKAVGAAAEKASGTNPPDSSDNLSTSIKAKREYNRALDDINSQLNRYNNR